MPGGHPLAESSFGPNAEAYERGRPGWPGGGVAVLYNAARGGRTRSRGCESGTPSSSSTACGPGDVDPWDTESWKVPMRERFGQLAEEELENVQRFSADELVAQYASFSSIGGLPPERRHAALAALGEVLERHGIREASLTYRTVVVTAAPASTSSG